jgi:hypothetical protein
VETARRARRRYCGETLPPLGEKPRSKGLHLHYVSGYMQAWLDTQIRVWVPPNETKRREVLGEMR